MAISCEYLAELIDISFEYFYIELTGINLIELETFKNIRNFENFDEIAVVLTNPSDIFKDEIDIYGAKINNGYIEINCWQINEELNYIANCLRISCNTYTMYDHNNNVINLELLKSLSAKYWSSF